MAAPRTLTERRAPLFLPVEIANALDLTRVPERTESAPSGRIEIDLANGCLIRVDEGIGLTTLRRVLATLRG